MVSVEPASLVFDLGEKPQFATTAEYKHSGQVTREDIQYCKLPGEEEYRYYSYYKSGKFTKPRIVIGSERNYNITGPLVEMDCYLLSITTMKLNYGINKTQTVVSGPYKYRDLSQL